jgi:hypothetical protein
MELAHGAVSASNMIEVQVIQNEIIRSVYDVDRYICTYIDTVSIYDRSVVTA